MAQLKILIVDDNARVGKVVKEYLGKFLDCEVTVYTDGYQTLKLLDEQKPPLDVIILDVMMRTHGGAVAEALRRKARYKDSMIIFYTALKTHQVDKKFLRGAYLVHKGEGALKKLVDTIKGNFRTAAPPQAQ
jgi:CheY-like chemotaxis protein